MITDVATLDTVAVPAVSIDLAATHRLLANFPELAYDWQLAHIFAKMLGIEPIDLIHSTMSRFGGEA